MAYTFPTSGPLLTRGNFNRNILTWRCVSRHSGVHLFHFATPKSGLDLRCFTTFHFQICVAPKRHIFFQHFNFQTCCENDAFRRVLFPNALRATTACIFSTSPFPNVLKDRRGVAPFASKGAARKSPDAHGSGMVCLGIFFSKV